MRLKVFQFLLLSVAALNLLGCATTNKGKILTSMGIGFALGAGIGSETSPKGENKTAHGLMWGALTAAALGAAGLYVFDEEKVSRALREENRKLVENLEGSHSEKTVEKEAQGTFTPADFPDEFKTLIRPGSFKVFKIDRWEREGEGRLVYKSRMIEFDPPKLWGQ